jgi:predicted Zn-dependent protease
VEEQQRLFDEILRWEPSFAPARLERAKLLARRNHPEQAVVEANKALAQASGNKELERMGHIFLAKTYFTLGRRQEARLHQAWIEAQPEPQNPSP